jgi:hypothetical protein
MTPMYDPNPPGDFFERAFAAYRRHCLRRGLVPDNPDPGGDIEGNTITLRAGDKILARYSWTGKRLLRLEQEDCHHE